jgi:tetratricopeptide (TPR) repeat protein
VPSFPPLLGARRAPTEPSGDTAPGDSGALKTGLDAHADAFDSTLGDVELLAARAALTQGRWQAARSLLLHTGDDWDRRGHRVTVLAREPYATAWAREWQLAEPESADAATLLALSLVRRALRGKEDPERAREACRTAAALAPADPTPWLGLLLLARTFGPETELLRTFAELRERHPEHHHGHHLLVARLAERPRGRGAESHEVYDLAEYAAAEAPADSPLAVLPVVAYAERYRVLAATGLAPADPAATGHWSGPRARRILRASFDWWLEWEHDEHPRRHIDLNHLAFAMSCAGRPAEAAALFQRIGAHATPAPWSYPHRDPRTAFATARARALGAM